MHNIDYQQLLDNALKSVVKEALIYAQFNGLGDNAGFFLYAVFIAAVQNDVVVLASAAHLYHLRRYHGKTLGAVQLHGIHVGRCQKFIQPHNLLLQEEILIRQAFIGLLEGEEILCPFRSAPQYGFYAVGSVAHPGVLHSRTVPEQIQARDLQ